MSGWWCCGCRESGCKNCAGIVPDELTVVFAGITGGFGYSCDSCDDLNDTFILSFEDFDNEGFPVCRWKYEFPSPSCGYDLIRLSLQHVGSNYIVSVSIIDNEGFSLQWATSFTSKPACSSWSGVVLNPSEGTPDACKHWDEFTHPYSTCELSA
ncbi:MAG: hypothetical protein RIC55_12660 [Pirellulaceae bacterium]